MPAAAHPPAREDADRSRRHDDAVSTAEEDGPALKDLVLITGFSGAGKSTAMAAFEDEGYFCVDNLPSEMIRSLVELFMHVGSKVEHAAVVSDARGGSYFEGLAAMLDDLRTTGVKLRVLFLEADEEALQTRYKETRRRHPLSPTGSVADGIARERRLLAPLRERADAVIDTTGLTAAMLRRHLSDEMLPSRQRGRLAVTFESFGFKYGTVRDPDLMLDVRFLPNPHYEPELRPLTGYRSPDRRVHQPRRRARPLLRAPAPAARLPAPAVPRRGQGAPRDRDRLHRRAPPLGRDRPAPGRALRIEKPTWSRSSTATSPSPRDRPRRFRGLRPGEVLTLLRRRLLRARRPAHPRLRARDRLRRQRARVLDRRPRSCTRPRIRPRRACSERQGGGRRRLPAGIAAGGADDGPPGQRPQYGRGTYAAYLRDPDGLRVEIVSRR